jgi:hypothetical protein
MADLRSRIIAANARLEQLVQEVCGACQHSCCHQGTMMGSEGLRRLEKGLLLEPDLTKRLLAGLALRQQELQEDVAVARQVAGLLAAANLPEEDRERLPELQRLVTELENFTASLSLQPPLNPRELSHLLLYSAVRHNLLRCLRQFPGAEAALTTLAGGRGSFRFRGRKLAPPRCIFHQDRCLAEDFKPIKCANFYCTGEPNLLSRCREVMDFDEFVRANIRAVSPDYVRRLVQLESELGPDYWEPKVVIGPEGQSEALAAELVSALQQGRAAVTVHRTPGRFMKSTNEIMAELRGLKGATNLILLCQAVDGAALYELAVAFERARSGEWHGGLLLVADTLQEHSFLPHPMWDDEMYSQPLGGLEVYYVGGQENG